MKLTHKFVKNIPDQVENGTIYISVDYSSAIHKCCCGCGNEVVTPFSPTDWELYFNGETVSLYPSIGNWSFKCHSHYFITNNNIEWMPKWSKEQIDHGRTIDESNKKLHFDKKRKKSIFRFFGN